MVFRGFSPSFPGFSGVRQVQKILGIFGVFLSFRQKTKEKKDRVTPPYRETGVAISLSHCVSCGIADYRCYTPTSVRKSGLSQSKDRPNKGYRRQSLPLKPIAL